MSEPEFFELRNYPNSINSLIRLIQVQISTLQKLPDHHYLAYCIYHGAMPLIGTNDYTAKSLPPVKWRTYPHYLAVYLYRVVGRECTIKVPLKQIIKTDLERRCRCNRSILNHNIVNS